MNREQAKELLPIIQAFAEGKQIQYQCDTDGWEDVESFNPTWVVGDPSSYRIKPEPRVIYVNEYKNGYGYPHKRLEQAIASVDIDHIRTIKFVEVIE